MFSNLWTDGLHINDGGVRKLSGNFSKFIKYCWQLVGSEKKDTSKDSRSCKKNGLKIAFLNIVSLRKHKHELRNCSHG